jgi:hypothetical protein
MTRSHMYDAIHSMQRIKLRLCCCRTCLCSWLLAAVFIFLQLRPFVASNHVETQRIARMLSELPPDVDIEGLVTKVLTATGNAGRGGAVAGRGGAAAASPPAAAPGGGVSAAMVLRSIWGPSSPPADVIAAAAAAAAATGANEGSDRKGKKA